MERLLWIAILFVIVGLCALTVTVNRLMDRLNGRLASLATSVTDERKRITALEDRVDLVIEPDVRRLEESARDLAKKVDSIPTEQIQTIYDSEKQFQDGLNAILGYAVETKKE